MKRQILVVGALALILASPAFADILVHDAYARAAMPGAPTGAAFMVLENTGPEDDRLIGVASDAAQRVELHTHIAGDNGVMQMRQVEEGFAVPAGSQYRLQRGGDHVMFMGLTQPFAQGDTVQVTLTFEKAGAMTVDIPVDLARVADHGAMPQGGMDHGAMGHGSLTPGN